MFFFPIPVCARECDLARRVWPSHPASAYSFCTLSLNLVLPHWIPPDFRNDVREQNIYRFVEILLCVKCKCSITQIIPDNVRKVLERNSACLSGLLLLV